MISKLKHVIQRFMGVKSYYRLKTFFDRYIFTYKKSYYSQYGEDVFLSNYFSEAETGFYVEVGAYHPRQCSNTYLLYKKGWNGLVIDASENIFSLFNSVRPRDIAVECLVAERECEVEFYSWGNHLENSGSKDQAKALINTLGEPDEIVIKQASTLKQLMEKHLPGDVSRIDLLSVDVEGMDLEVLKSFDWDRWKPSIVIAEFFSDDVDEIIGSDIYRFISNNNYHLVSWNKPSLIFEYSAR